MKEREKLLKEIDAMIHAVVEDFDHGCKHDVCLALRSIDMTEIFKRLEKIEGEPELKVALLEPINTRILEVFELTFKGQG